MNATPLLGRILGALKEHHLEAVLIGNAAAAIHGAPVTTLGFDFMCRATPANLRKLKAVARSLGAMILRAYYPVSKFYRVVDDATGLQADFMPAIHGVKSFAGLRSRAQSKTSRPNPPAPTMRMRLAEAGADVGGRLKPDLLGPGVAGS